MTTNELVTELQSINASLQTAADRIAGRLAVPPPSDDVPTQAVIELEALKDKVATVLSELA